MRTRKAKIAATLGPACDEPAVLAQMLEAGLDVARLNFSHGTIDDHKRRVRQLRLIARKAGANVSLLADLQGPRFRVGRLRNGLLELEEGSVATIVAGSSRARPGWIPVSYAALAQDVKRGDSILFDDGKIVLRVERVRDGELRCVVVRGGVLTDHKGINIPGRSLSVPSLMPKDRRDLRHAVDLGADWLAVSFVRSGEDIRQAKRLLAAAGSSIPVMAKIERPEAVERLEEILEASDGLLVARGDLGVELPTERVPMLQKQIIEAANAAGKPVMTATQMLESMRGSRRPTRAEASDVANAVLDGSGCLLLTAETAAGQYPVEAVAMMAAIIDEAEASGRLHVMLPRVDQPSITQTTCRAGCRAASDVGAKYIVVFTLQGLTARQTARFRPQTPILALTPSAAIARRVGMYWGVRAHTVRRLRTVERLMEVLDATLLAESIAAPGEVVVVLSGSPIGMSSTTNLMKVHEVGAVKPGR